MTKDTKPSLLIRLLSPQGLTAAGCGLCVALTIWIFMPNGFLDSLTKPDEMAAGEEQSDLIIGDQEEDVAADLSQDKNAAFLSTNSKKDGVRVTASGLQIRTLKAGAGKKPAATDTVTVHYTGALINGKVFDSSIKRGEPISFPLNGVIAGWTEGLQLMHEGETAEIVIPQDLGYGARGSPGAIPPHQTLVFQVELIRVE